MRTYITMFLVYCIPALVNYGSETGLVRSLVLNFINFISFQFHLTSFLIRSLPVSSPSTINYRIFLLCSSSFYILLIRTWSKSNYFCKVSGQGYFRNPYIYTIGVRLKLGFFYYITPTECLLSLIVTNDIYCSIYAFHKVVLTTSVGLTA